MNIKTYFLGALAAMALGLTSCNLDLDPNFAKKADGIRENPSELLDGTISKLWNENLYGRNEYYGADIGTDNVVPSWNTSGRFTNRVNLTSSPANCDLKPYLGLYQVVESANFILETAPSFFKDDAQLQDLKGQAYFLRALADFKLVKNYGGVPLVNKVMTNDSEETKAFQPKNATPEEIYTQVLADLAKAETMIKNTTDVQHPTVNAVYALRTRVYLFIADEEAGKVNGLTKEQALEEVVKNADKVTGVSLVPAKDFLNYFNGQNSADETIFEFGVTADNSNGTNNQGNLYLHDGYNAFCANPTLLAVFKKGDVRDDFMRKAYHLSSEGDTIKYVFPEKFKEASGVFGLTAPKILRYAEVLLNKAEALAQLNKTAEAAAILDQLRAQRFEEGVTPPKATGTLNEVLTERRKELAFEGFRLFDLRRNHLATTSQALNSSDGHLMDIASAQAGSPQFWMPIPVDKVLANPNLQQTHYAVAKH